MILTRIYLAIFKHIDPRLHSSQQDLPPSQFALSGRGRPRWSLMSSATYTLAVKGSGYTAVFLIILSTVSMMPGIFTALTANK